MKKLLLALALPICLLVSACGTETTKQSPSSSITINYTLAMQKLGFTTPVTLPSKPEKVVSLVHVPVQTLYELGINQIGIPATKMFQWDDGITKTAKQFNVSMNANFDIENIVALQPDLVILGYQSKSTYGKVLEREHIPVYYVDAGHVTTYASVKATTYALLEAFGNLNPEKTITIKENFDKLETRVAEFKKSNIGKTAMVLQSSPPRHFIQTNGGSLGSIVDMLGYKNVYTNNKTKMVLLDFEQALSYNPDIVFTVGGSKTASEHKMIMETGFNENKSYWHNIPAIKENNVVYLPIQYVAASGLNMVNNIHQLIDTLEDKSSKQ